MTPNNVTAHNIKRNESVPEVAPPAPLDRVERIIIEFIPQEQQRYVTVGDWYFEDGTLKILVTKLEDMRYAAAIAVHELVEALLCTQRGITPEQVDEFDKGEGGDYDEPGDHPSSPYHREHLFATATERRFINQLGVDWDTYNSEVTSKGESHGNETPVE